MKIRSHEPSENPGESQSGRNDRKTQGTGGGERKAGQINKTGPDDNGESSDKCSEAASILAAVGQLPDVRETKVEEIKWCIEAGIYTLDPRKIAERMLQEL